MHRSLRTINSAVGLLTLMGMWKPPCAVGEPMKRQWDWRISGEETSPRSLVVENWGQESPKPHHTEIQPGSLSRGVPLSIASMPMLLNLHYANNHLLLQLVSDLVGVWWGPRLCISNKLLYHDPHLKSKGLYIKSVILKLLGLRISLH